MIIMEIKITSLDSIHEAAKQFIAAMEDNTVFAFYGKMGAGKTTFIKAVCEELGVTDVINSPTFAIVNEYRGDNASIFHFDLYRLTDEDDLYSTGFYDYIEQDGITVTEWTELFESEIPSDALKLKIERIDENTRRFTLC